MTQDAYFYWFHSDDYGYQPYSDERIFSLLSTGKLKSLSILANLIRGKTTEKIHKLASYQPHVKIGLHLNITEGKSIESSTLVESLIRKKGEFFPFWAVLVLIFTNILEPKHLAREISAQIQELIKKGIRPDMIDSHHHIHAFSPIAEVVEEQAKTHNIPVIRSYNNVKTHTISAKITYLLLKLGAFCSYVITYRKLGLPSSWKSNGSPAWSFLGWEAETFDIEKSPDARTMYVIHPLFRLDPSTSYSKLLL